MKNAQFLVILVLVIGTVCSCQSEYEIVETTSVPMDSTLFELSKELPILENEAINEASGIAASWYHENAFWIHNDSGDKPRLFLVDTQGKTLATLTLYNIEARDWEDIALNVEDSIPYLYVAEIGDNQAQYEDKYIYRFPEPTLENGETEITISAIDIIQFAYPQRARDAESLLVDPLTKDILIISKREEFSKIFELAFPYSYDTVNVLVEKGELPFRNTVAGDISPDGKGVLLKTYDEVFYWERKGKESAAELLTTQGVRIPYFREPQGEAIAWGKEGTTFYTLSEEYMQKPARFYKYKRK